MTPDLTQINNPIRSGVNLPRMAEFMTERELIRMRRVAGHKPFWTKDRYLQAYKFTNVFRQYDRTTLWYTRNIAQNALYEKTRMLATVVFRWFNRIESGDVIFNQPDLITGLTPFEWYVKTGKADAIVGALKTTYPKGPWITGAYMILSPPGVDKLTGVCQMLEDFYEKRGGDEQFTAKTLETAHEWFLGVWGLGDFMAYELVTDLRHTLLQTAPDVNTWANAGPGAKRGILRLLDKPLTSKAGVDWLYEMRRVHAALPEHLPDWFPALELRDVEHSLCEFDKYERVRTGEGTPKQRYAY